MRGLVFRPGLALRGSRLDRFVGMAVFAKVVESASFAAAARHFDMSPAMVSKHIRTLEERLGVRLLNRTTRRVSATEVGQNYYERCLRILNELEDAERAAGDLASRAARPAPGDHVGVVRRASTRAGDRRLSRRLSRRLDRLEPARQLCRSARRAHRSGDPPRPAFGFEPDRQKIICGRNDPVRLAGLSGGERHAAKTARSRRA